MAENLCEVSDADFKKKKLYKYDDSGCPNAPHLSFPDGHLNVGDGCNYRQEFDCGEDDVDTNYRPGFDQGRQEPDICEAELEENDYFPNYYYATTDECESGYSSIESNITSDNASNITSEDLGNACYELSPHLPHSAIRRATVGECDSGCSLLVSNVISNSATNIASKELSSGRCDPSDQLPGFYSNFDTERENYPNPIINTAFANSFFENSSRNFGSSHYSDIFSNTSDHSSGFNTNSATEYEYNSNPTNNAALDSFFPRTNNNVSSEVSQCATSSSFGHRDTTEWLSEFMEDRPDIENRQSRLNRNHSTSDQCKVFRDPATADATGSNYNTNTASATFLPMTNHGNIERSHSSFISLDSSGYLSGISSNSDTEDLSSHTRSLFRRFSFAGRSLEYIVASTDSSTYGDGEAPETCLSSTDSSSVDSLVSQLEASRINSLENLATALGPSETDNFGWRRGYRRPWLTTSSESVVDWEFSDDLHSNHKHRRLTHKRKLLPKFKDEFPNEVLVEIMKHLSICECIRLERVCKRWTELVRLTLRRRKVVSFESIFGRSAESQCTPIMFTNKELSAVLSRCGARVRMLNLEAFRGLITFEANAMPGHVGRCLVSVNLSDIQLNQDALTWFGSHCRCLVDVNFHNCFQKEFDVAWENFFKCCPRLEKIDICGSFVNRTDYGSLAKLPSLARFINLGEIRVAHALINNLFRTRFCNLGVLILGFNDFHYETCIQPLMMFLSRLERLHTLRINMQLMINSEREYHDLDFSRLGNLTDLVFTGAHLTAKTVRSIAQHCRKLALLDLSGDYSVESAEGFKEIAEMSRLTCLKISTSLADDAVVKCITSGPVGRSLRFLSLRMNDSLTDAGVESVLKNCKELVSLDLSHDKLLTDKTVMALKNYVEQRSSKREVQEKFTTKQLDSIFKDRVAINIPIAKRCYHALAASVRNWNLTPFIDFRAHCSKGRKETDVLRLHAWLGRTGVTKPYCCRHPLLKIYDNNLDQAPYFRLSHRDYRCSSPTFF